MLGEKIDSTDQREQCTDAALEQGSSHILWLKLLPTKILSTVSHGSDLASKSSKSVIPLMEYLRSKESLQNEVKRCLADLKNLNEAATRGTIKS